MSFRFMFKALTIVATLLYLPSFLQADNILTDSFLQPHNLKSHPTQWSLGLKYGLKEGSGEIENDGFRLEIPRLTLQKNVDNQILFLSCHEILRHGNFIDHSKNNYQIS